MKWRVALIFLGILAGGVAKPQSGTGRMSGSVLDPSGLPLVGAHVEVDSTSGARFTAVTGSDGTFSIYLPASGPYIVRVAAAGFAPIMRNLQLSAVRSNVTLRLQKVSALDQEIVVTTDVSEIDIDLSRSFAESDGARRIARRQPRPARRARFHSRPAHRDRVRAASKRRSILFPAWPAITASPSRSTLRWAATWCPTTSPPTRTATATPTRISTSPARWAAWRRTAAPSMCSKAITR